MQNATRNGKTFRSILAIGLLFASLYIWAIAHQQHQNYLNFMSLKLAQSQQTSQIQAQTPSTSIAVTSQSGPQLPPQNPSSGLSTSGTTLNPDPEQMPAGLYPALLQTQQADTSDAYAVVERGEKDWQAFNPAQNFTAHFSSNGVDFESWQMRLSGLGWEGQNLTPLAAVSPTGQGQRIEYQRPEGVSEWYLNGPLGLEQGFTLAHNLTGQPTPSSWLALELSVQGANVTSSGAGDWLELKPTNGPALRYGKLYVYDAEGQVLPSRLEVQTGGKGLRLLTDISQAHFPVTLDPFIQQQILTPSDGANRDSFGVSVALNATGDTALIGAYGKTINGNLGQGAVYYFSRNANGSWSQQQILTDTISGASGDDFGTSVALNATGDTALIGAFGRTVGGKSSQGAVYVFNRSGGIFTQQQILTDTISGASNDNFGSSVALNATGDTALIGAANKTIGANTHQGAVYIFNRNAGSFSQQQVLTDTIAGAASDGFGTWVALNAAGDTAFIGADAKNIGSNINQGAAYVFNRNGGGVWSQQQMLTTSDGAARDHFGASLALNAAGDTALISSNGKNLNGNLLQGAVYYFSRGVGGVWSQQQIITDTISGASPDRFGTSIALSASGDTALIGAYFKNIGATPAQGAAYIFNRSGGVFVQQQILSDTVSGDREDGFGISVALNTTGDISLIGASSKTFGVNMWQGAAYIFSNALVVTHINGDGAATTPGTLSYALNQGSGVTITFALTQGNTITFTGPLTPVVKTGVTLDGGSGAGIVLNGNGVTGDGLQLQGHNTLRNLTVRKFAGRDILITGRGNKFSKVVVRKN